MAHYEALRDGRGFNIAKRIVALKLEGQNIVLSKHGLEPHDSAIMDRVEAVLRVGHDFVAKGAKRVVILFRKRWSIERLFSRAKEWLMLDGLRVRGLAQLSIHVSLSLISVLVVALSAVRLGCPGLVRCIKGFVE